MPQVWICLLLCLPAVWAGGGEADPARAELERTERLVAEGALPKAKLEEARAAAADEQDALILRDTLYGPVSVEDLGEPRTARMIEAAQRRVERAQAKLGRMRTLVEAGALPRNTLAPLEEDLGARERERTLAESRAVFWRDLAEMARAEAALAEESPDTAPALAESYAGDRPLSAQRLSDLDTAFRNRFGRPLPVSANGDTPFHRSLGFDHRGRADVALHPDGEEGQWLRETLAAARIPHIAFRGRVPGKSTAAHIHLGPPSTRLRTTD